MLMNRAISSLLDEIDDLKQRVSTQTAHVESCTGDEFLEEHALLRNLVMQLEGLKLKLRRWGEGRLLVRPRYP